MTGPTGYTGPTGAPSVVTGPTGPSITGPTGAASVVTGPTGPNSTGPTGAASVTTGPTGYTGPSVTGATGPTGSQGTSITIIGSVMYPTDLPSSYGGAIGDAYIVESNGDLYVWNGSSWVNVGQIQGPTGATGAASVVTGPTGTAGVTGATGPGGTGPTGPAGTSGLGTVYASSPGNNDVLLFNTSTGAWVAVPSVYEIGISITGIMNNSEMLLQYVLPVGISIPSGATGSYAIANIAATASTTVQINKNGSSIGSINWGASSTTGTYTFTSAVTFAAGDVLQLVAPSTADTTLANVGITIAATRT